MQPILEKVITTPNNTISVEEVRLPYFISQWHFHPEIEIIRIVESTGTLFIGDTIKAFKPGDMALIGSGVPHVWLNDKDYYAGNEHLIACSQVIKFHASFWGNEFSNLPEMRTVNELIIKSGRGIWITGSLKNKVEKLIEKCISFDGVNRIICVLEILSLISQFKPYHYLSTPFESKNLTPGDFQRIDKVYKFLMENFAREISLAEIANIASMNPSAFCRYFKTHTLKTVSEVVNEIRVAYACKLLSETDRSVSEICFNSGFNYLSNFYKQFEKIKKTSPGDYRKALLAK